jgi:hypothetical protein
MIASLFTCRIGELGTTLATIQHRAINRGNTMNIKTDKKLTLSKDTVKTLKTKIKAGFLNKTKACGTTCDMGGTC